MLGFSIERQIISLIQKSIKPNCFQMCYLKTQMKMHLSPKIILSFSPELFNVKKNLKKLISALQIWSAVHASCF